ncbi:hypothetical protein QF021_000256 [Acidovorax delafieldii]|uniref:hypothetical protein n=1 Tax=Acidovorax delafieldii TaxID=47920 RepID=UPI00286745B4|nr:hypothetical protein [Acidovorax delafieldii]MDR6152167.1 hypothetical protein [Acidovorax delafieldii]
MQGGNISPQDASTARAVLKAVLQTLSLEVRRAIDASGKDGIAPVAHAFFAVQFVGQPQTLEGLTRTDELAHALSAEGPVKLPAGVAHADDELHPATAELAVGFGFDGGRYLLVVGAWACPINELRAHGCLLSGCDVAMLIGAAKYLHKGAGADVVAGDLI